MTPALGTPTGVLTSMTGLPLTTGVTGILPEANGGTDQSTYATGDILFANATNSLAKLAAGSNGEVLTLAAGVPSWAAAAGGGLWSEAGITTLGSAGDTITVGSLTLKQFVSIIINVASTGGTISTELRFNADSGTNYERNLSTNYAAPVQNTGQDSVLMQNAFTTGKIQVNISEFTHVATEEKLFPFTSIRKVAASAPDMNIGSGNWTNASDAITAVNVVNGGTGDFAIGSLVQVLHRD